MNLLSRQNHPLVKHWLALRNSRQARQKAGSCLLTTLHEIFEIGKSLELKTLIMTEGQSPPPGIRAQCIQIVTPSLLSKITGCPAPAGFAAEAPLPPPAQSLGSWSLILDGVSDPGNVGTLLRTALALGWDTAILLPGSADPFQEKCLRASKGAPYRLPTACWSHEKLLQELQRSPKPVYIADLQGEKPHALSPPCCLVVGNESHGPSSVWDAYPRIFIPQQGTMESLNVSVAGGILMTVLRGIL